MVSFEDTGVFGFSHVQRWSAAWHCIWWLTADPHDRRYPHQMWNAQIWLTCMIDITVRKLENFLEYQLLKVRDLIHSCYLRKKLFQSLSLCFWMTIIWYSFVYWKSKRSLSYPSTCISIWPIWSPLTYSRYTAQTSNSSMFHRPRDPVGPMGDIHWEFSSFVKLYRVLI